MSQIRSHVSLRVILLAYLALLHLAVGLLISRPDLAMRLHRGVTGATPGATPFVASMHRHHQRLAGNIEPGAVLFVGSSSIQGLDVGAVADRAVNLGIGSDTVAGVLERWPTRAIAHARAVVVAIGLNDLLDHEPVEAVSARFAELLARVPADLPVVVSGIQSLGAAVIADRPGLDAQIVQLNQSYRALCAGRPRCQYADTAAALARCPGGPVHEPDGIHLGTAGYRCWKAALRAGLDALDVSGVRAEAGPP
jgi:lysophospholipase L1-like esterase